jgi:two-component system nitrogen regulation response regulator GlnG
MHRKTQVWVVDDDSSIRWVLERALNQAGISNESFADADQLLQRMNSEQPEVIISDIRMPGTDGLELLSLIYERHPELPVIITTAHSDLDSAVASYQRGAFEYLPKPFDLDEVIAITERALAQASEHRGGQPEPGELPQTEIIGEAPAMQEVFRAIGRLAHSNITVLINGESGTGKELVARALHRHSPRAANPFIALNMADGGTLFLDEIGDMPAETQTRLLRVLADGEFYRVGGHTPVRTDVRIIAATHQNLEDLVRDGDFREDLFHRLNVIRIHIPKLAERREDIPRLMQYFFQQAAEELGGDPKVLLPETEEFLVGLDWPGNVRQLENTCRWITVMASGREVHLRDLPPELGNRPAPETPSSQADWRDLLRHWARNELIQGKHQILQNAVPDFEQVMIEVALQHTQGRKRDAAELLGWGRNTLTRKIKELDLGL